MGDPDFCEKKCPICTRAREGNRLARFVQSVEMLVTFGGCPPRPSATAKARGPAQRAAAARDEG